MNSPDRGLLILSHIGCLARELAGYDAHICLGETRTDTLNRFDLCYSFKMLCRAEYEEPRQLHLAMKNYAVTMPIPPEHTKTGG